MSYHSWPAPGGGSGGSAFWGDAVPNLSNLPASGTVVGEFRQTLDTKSIWRWTGTVWELYLDIPGEIDHLDDLTGNVQDQLDAITSDVSVIDIDLQTAEDDIVDLKAADVSLDGRLDTLEGQSLDSRLSTVETETASLDSRLDTYDGQNLHSRLTTAEGEIDTLQANEIALTDRVDDLEADRVLKAGDTMTGPLILDADPSLPLGAATKAYVDSLVNNARWKLPVRAATIANITLSGEQTIDGVALVAGERVLVKDQSTASQNGIYQVSAGAWARTLDADAFSELNGAICLVQEGTANGNKGFQQNSELTSLASNQTWIQNFGVSLYQADDTTLEQTGNTFRIKDGGVNLAGAKVTGINPVSKGGTGATTAAQALLNLAPSLPGNIGNVLGYDGANIVFLQKQATSEKGQVGGYAPLDTFARVPPVHLPSLKEFTYIPNANFEDTVDGQKPFDWNYYNDGAVAIPVDGTGGTASGITFLVLLAAAIRGTRSARLSKSAVNAQGQGVSCDFTIEKPDRNKTLNLYVETEASTNYVAGDAAFYLINLTTGAVITPTVAQIPKLDGRSWEIQFDLENSLTYRLCAHIATTSALAWTLDLDSMIFDSKSSQSSSRTKGPRVRFTPTFNNVAVSDNGSYYQKDGEDVEITLDVSAAGSASGLMLFNPSSLGIAGVGVDPVDYNVLPTRQNIGSCLYIGSTKNYVVAPSYAGTTNQIRFALNDNVSSVGNSEPSGNTVVLNTRLTGTFKLPIAIWTGLSSSVDSHTEEEYASNNASGGSSAGTNYTTGSVQGKAGSSFPDAAVSGTTATTSTGYDVVFNSDIRDTDIINIQINPGGNGGWVTGNQNSGAVLVGGQLPNGVAIGMYWQQISARVIRVYFGNAGRRLGTSYGTGTGNWGADVATWKWRIQRLSPKKPAGVYKAGKNRSGFVSQEDSTVLSSAISGATTSPAVAGEAYRVGDLVTVTIPAVYPFTKNGSAGVVAAPGLLPSGFRPSGNFNFVQIGAVAGVNGARAFQINTNGDFTMYGDTALGNISAGAVNCGWDAAITFSFVVI